MKYLAVMENKQAFRLATFEAKSPATAKRLANEMAELEAMKLIETKPYRGNIPVKDGYKKMERRDEQDTGTKANTEGD